MTVKGFNVEEGSGPDVAPTETRAPVYSGAAA